MQMAPGVFSFGRDQWDPSHRFVTSWLLPPWLLFGFRALLSLYAFTVSLFSIGWYCQHAQLGGCQQARNEFSFFTVLTYWGLAFYFLASAFHTLTYILSGRPLLDRFPRPLQALHSLYYTTICVYPVIVTVVYWGVLYSGTWFKTDFDAWSNISRHAMNSAFAIFEITLPRTDLPPWAHLLWLIVILASYLGLAYLTRATRGFYVYGFLNPAKGSGLVAGYVFGIAVGCIVVYLLVRGLIWLRKWVTETKLGMGGKFAARDGGASGVAMTGDPETARKTERPS